jgi:hypothetical protein
VNPLERLREAGVSIWLDTRSRGGCKTASSSGWCASAGSAARRRIRRSSPRRSPAQTATTATSSAGRRGRARPAGAVLRARAQRIRAATEELRERYEESDGTDGFDAPRPRRRQRRHDRASARAVEPAPTAELDDQGPAPRRRAGDRGVDRARRQRTRHAAVRDRALRTGHRRLPNGPEAPSGRRASIAAAGVGGIVLRLARRHQSRCPAAAHLPAARRDRNR